MSSEVDAIKKLIIHSRRYREVFADARIAMTALQRAEARIAEGERMAAERDQALARHGAAVLAADEAVKALEALQASIEPTRAKLKAELDRLEWDYLDRVRERQTELGDIDLEIAGKRYELEEIEVKLKAIAANLGGGVDETV
jgi:chromosome segregation ATPase